MAKQQQQAPKFQLTPRQLEAFNLLTDHSNGVTEVMYGGAAGGGKTRLGCMWVVKGCIKWPGSRWVIGRAVLARLRETTLRSLQAVLRESGLDRNCTYNASTNVYTFSNGSEIFLKDLKRDPSDPMFDSLGSLEITGAFVDEVAEIDQMARQVLSTRIRHKLTDFALIPKMLFTTNPCKTWPYTDFYLPFTRGELPSHMRFVQSLHADNPFLPKSYADQLSRLPQSLRLRLLEGKWDAEEDPMALMTTDAIIDCYSTELPLVRRNGQVVATVLGNVQDSTRYLTVDVARLGQDRTVVVVWTGLHVDELHVLEKSDTVATASFVRNLASRHAVRPGHIVVDVDGVGGGVVDQLRGCVSFANGSRPLHGENFANLKSQCWHALAELVERGEVSFGGVPGELRDLLTGELENVRRAPAEDVRRVAVEAKSEMKARLGRSPDLGDALMLRMWFHVLSRRGSGSPVATLHVLGI